jgi:hypothetical protein
VFTQDARSRLSGQGTAWQRSEAERAVWASNGGRRWADGPPTWALPVTVAGDLVLVRQAGALVRVGPICAYPAGFVFYLTVSFNPGQVAGRNVGFHVRTPQERASATRIRVTYADGQMADSAAWMSGEQAPGRLLLRFDGGGSVIRDYFQVPRAESRWWVSPLPPPGPVGFTVFLQGAAEPSGTAAMDADPIIAAARRSQALWPEAAPQ